MRFLSFQHKSTGQASWGALIGDQIIDLGALTGIKTLGAALKTHTVEELEATYAGATPTIEVADVSYLPVITDNVKIFCIGLAYHDHRLEAGRPESIDPTVFVRFANSQVGHQQPLLIPVESDAYDFEGEIAVVIGRQGRRISEADAWSHIAGYSAYNDGTVRDWQQRNGKGANSQWTPGKNWPQSGGFGPTLVTRNEIADGQELTLTTRLNGVEMQHATTKDLIFSIPKLVAFCSTFTELEPGDVIITGTPGGVGFKRNPPVFMKDGDVVEVEVSVVGTLVNPVVKERAQ